MKKDPLINGRLTEKECGNLVSEMIALTSTYLPQGWKEQVFNRFYINITITSIDEGTYFIKEEIKQPIYTG